MKASRYPVDSRSTQVNLVAARYLGGGAAANLTKVTGRGITSVNYNAATGKYLITFEEPHPALLAITITCGTGQTTALQNLANYDPANYNAANGTMPFFVTDVATPTAQDLTTTEEVSIIAVFSETAIAQ